ncbi:DUF5615 family PIN-like protein [Spirulina subsalsa FACHB-351]|uniref:DUF5615 family PIN-like protein n=1 Tax=Spirulina subsalsa FACHB-351 TaxID=234711 RepID=A0ABT3L3S1_9CYAN|nr:DUF5615 family PIN-like protein [Spirulina subsalsa]MCW6035635.1 DUF5615 family PIN-like protein [Spirulina subsalsa FACHB-351]
MRILLDTCVSALVLSHLLKAGFDVVWTGDWLTDPDDEEILATAYRENRILVTLDKDFGELAILQQHPHCGILRLVNLSTQQQCTICLQILTTYGAELASGAIITAERGRVRIRQSDT